MIESRKKVIEVYDRLFQVKPHQIVIDIVQDMVEEIAHADDVTPDAIGAASYNCSILIDVYNPSMQSDIDYLYQLLMALEEWQKDADFANKSLGLDPNK